MYGATARGGYQLTQTKTYQALVRNDDSVFEYEMVLKVEGQQSFVGIHDSAVINSSSIIFPDGQILGLTDDSLQVIGKSMNATNDEIIRMPVTPVSDNANNGIEVKANTNTISLKYYFFEPPHDLEIRFKVLLKNQLVMSQCVLQNYQFHQDSRFYQPNEIRHSLPARVENLSKGFDRLIGFNHRDVLNTYEDEYTNANENAMNTDVPETQHPPRSMAGKMTDQTNVPQTLGNDGEKFLIRIEIKDHPSLLVRIDKTKSVSELKEMIEKCLKLYNFNIVNKDIELLFQGEKLENDTNLLLIAKIQSRCVMVMEVQSSKM